MVARTFRASRGNAGLLKLDTTKSISKFRKFHACKDLTMVSLRNPCRRCPACFVTIPPRQTPTTHLDLQPKITWERGYRVSLYSHVT
jgi:hypothetical protein